MSSSYKSDYFHYLEENFPDEAVKEFNRCRLSIEEMRDLFINRSKEPGCHACYNIELIKDELSGLYYTDHDFILCNDLLTNHILAEQLCANKEKVDWKRVTNCYDQDIICKIDETLDAPLIWLPTEDVGDRCVVVGKVAAELLPPENMPIDEGRSIYFQLRDEGLLWFADTLPTINDIYDTSGYDKMPEGMILWDRLMQAGFMTLRDRMEFIVKNRGYAKAVEIIERFRAAWDDIMMLRLFNIWKLDKYEQERRRMELFEQMEPYLRGWKSKIPQAPEPEITDQQNPAQVHLQVNIEKVDKIESIEHLEKLALGDIVGTKIEEHKQ